MENGAHLHPAREEFTDLMAQVRGGDQDAVAELLQYCEGHLLRAVRTRLNRMLRTKFDSQDFVQSVWASFFANFSMIERFDTPEDVVRFLVRVASNKVVSETRRRLISRKRNVNLEQSISTSTNLEGVIPPSPGPSPSELVAAKECWEHVLSRQPPRYREIFELRISGLSPDEVAERLNVNVRTVFRALAQIVAAFAANN